MGNELGDMCTYYKRRFVFAADDYMLDCMCILIKRNHKHFEEAGEIEMGNEAQETRQGNSFIITFFTLVYRRQRWKCDESNFVLIFPFRAPVVFLGADSSPEKSVRASLRNRGLLISSLELRLIRPGVTVG